MIRIINPSGLGNRIKGTVSALRIADSIKDTVHNYDYPNDEIFTFEQTEHKTKEEVINCQTWQLELFDDDSDSLKNKNIFLSVCGEGGIHFLNEGAIDFQYFNISDKMILEYLKYFNKIKFNFELLQKSKKFCSDNDIKNCIGVHIRTWGDDLYRNNKLFDIQDYILEMDKYENNFFVCADDDSVIKKLISIYGDRIITASNFNINNKHIRYSEKYHEALYAATLDLLCYSECKSYIGTYQSTFSEVAWWLSGARKNITIPVPKFIKYYRDNYENNT